MPTETWAGPLGELRAASTAGGGTALTTSAVAIAIPDGTHHLQITPRNFSTAVVVKMAVNPFLTVLLTTNNLSTVTDGSGVLQDGKSSTVLTLNSLDVLANGDFLLVGARLPFRGVAVVGTNGNSNASVLTVKYWNGAWTSASATDGTASAGATFAQNGNVTWTPPSDWVAANLKTIATPAPGASVVKQLDNLFWTRWEVSAQLDSTVSLQSMLALNRSTAYAEYISGQTLEMTCSKGPGGVGCIEALTDAGTANLVVNVASRYGDGGFS